MSASLGQPIVVENVTGATGNIGVARLVHSTPDGYTIVIGNMATHVANGVLFSLRYDVRDMEPIALLPSNPFIVLSHASVPAKSLTELVAWIKANPNEATLGYAGPGSGHHLAGLLFEKLTGATLRYVPYRGAAPALVDLMAGHVKLMIEQSPGAIPQLRNENIRIYAVTAATRLASAPAVPTAEEANLPGFHISIWNGLWAPKNTPQPVIARLNAAAMEAMADPTVIKRLTDLGQELPPSGLQSPAALAAFQKAEIDKWWPVLKAANVNAD
ncbi:tripartite tricarboxylate transporter substrate-binding protein [Bradyrhizobium sp. UFLA05-109]